MSIYRKIFISLLVALLVTLCVIPFNEEEYVVVPVRQLELKEYSVTALVEHFAEEYKTDPAVMLKIGQCESGFDENAWNKSDPNGGSHGYMQFQTSTFYSYAKKLNIENPDIKDKVQQAQVSAYMFSIGEGKQWTTYMAYKNGGTYTFTDRKGKTHTVHCK